MNNFFRDRLGLKFLYTLLILGMLFINSNSYAAEPTTPAKLGDDTVSRVICNIVLTLNGPISQAIATLVIIITGYSFFVGKVSIGMLFIVAAGIMMVFGAQSILGLILGKTIECKGGVIAPPTDAK